jgi:hypothetical protein
MEAILELWDELDQQRGFDEEALLADGEDWELAAFDLAVGSLG